MHVSYFCPQELQRIANKAVTAMC